MSVNRCDSTTAISATSLEGAFAARRVSRAGTGRDAARRSRPRRRISALDRAAERRRFGLRPTASVRGNENMEDLATSIATAGFVAVGLILLLACTNVAHLLLARGTRRSAELAVRAALGAGRMRIARLLFIESVLLALGGGVAGLGLARALMPLTAFFESQRTRGVAFGIEPVVDLRVLAFTFLVSVATAVVFGLVPALRASKPDLARAFAGEGIVGIGNRSRRGFGRALIVTETAISLVLVLTAGLFARSFVGVEQIDPAFDARHTAAIGFELGIQGYSETQGAAVPRAAQGSRAELAGYLRRADERVARSGRCHTRVHGTS